MEIFEQLELLSQGFFLFGSVGKISSRSVFSAVKKAISNTPEEFKAQKRL